MYAQQNSELFINRVMLLLSPLPSSSLCLIDETPSPPQAGICVKQQDLSGIGTYARHK